MRAVAPDMSVREAVKHEQLLSLFPKEDGGEIAKVLAQTCGDVQEAATALLFKRTKQALAREWEPAGQAARAKSGARKKRAAFRSGGGGGRKRACFTVYLHGLPWSVPSEEVVEDVARLFDPREDADDSIVADVRFGRGARQGCAFVDLVASEKNRALARK